jgi:hypothetical protein
MPSVALSQSTTDTLLMLNAAKQIQNNRQNEEIKKELKEIKKGLGIEETKPEPKEPNKAFGFLVIPFAIFLIVSLAVGYRCLIGADIFGEAKHLEKNSFKKAQEAYTKRIMSGSCFLSILVFLGGMVILSNLAENLGPGQYRIFGLSESVTGGLLAIPILCLLLVPLFTFLIYGSSSAYRKRLQNLYANGAIQALPQTLSPIYLRKEKNLIRLFFIFPYWITLFIFACGFVRCMSIIGYHVTMAPLHNLNDLLLESSMLLLPFPFTIPMRFLAKKRLAFIDSLSTELVAANDTQQKKLNPKQDLFFIKLSDNRIKGPFSKAKIKEGIKQNKIPSGCFVSQLKTGPWKALPTG